MVYVPRPSARCISFPFYLKNYGMLQMSNFSCAEPNINGKPYNNLNIPCKCGDFFPKSYRVNQV